MPRKRVSVAAALSDGSASTVLLEIKDCRDFRAGQCAVVQPDLVDSSIPAVARAAVITPNVQWVIRRPRSCKRIAANHNVVYIEDCCRAVESCCYQVPPARDRSSLCTSI